MYRLSPPSTTGFHTRLRIVGTVVTASLGASVIMWLGGLAVSFIGSSSDLPAPSVLTSTVLVHHETIEANEIATDSPNESLPTNPGQGPVVARRTVVHPIQNGESFGSLLGEYGVPNARRVIEATRPHFNMAKIKAGRHLKFDFLGTNLTQMTYEIDADRTLTVDFADDQLHAEVHTMEWTPKLAHKELVLNSSLWSAATGAGFKPADIVTLAQIFEYDIDFGSELQKGARFTIVMDELHREDGEAVKTGDFHAVKLINGAREYTAIRYKSSKGSTGWYHPDGKATARPFLRSPLEFTRVTSHFGVKRRTHYHGGVDMGAATGTPIRAAADGKVVIAGWRGAYGKHVKLSHKRYGPYHTSYSHMSKIKVRNGQHVKQGQVIGLIGSTGRSTGPHLHYEFHIRGKRVNPMKTKLPGSKSLPKSEVAAFKKVAAEWLPKLDGLDPSTALAEAE